ncbi:hypothetical protein VZT92_024291 [Zoarces viviparus]|uniref:Uncharacterized protein n=1 Tax=Zoarces viviparus TaxID=48416 RepID=A0AAW1E1K5_ZOAVI
MSAGNLTIWQYTTSQTVPVTAQSLSLHAATQRHTKDNNLPLIQHHPAQSQQRPLSLESSGLFDSLTGDICEPDQHMAVGLLHSRAHSRTRSGRLQGGV